MQQHPVQIPVLNDYIYVHRVSIKGFQIAMLSNQIEQSGLRKYFLRNFPDLQ